MYGEQMKIDKDEFEAFRLTLPEDIRNECFSWLRTCYCVPTALFIAHKQELELGTLNVKTWCKALGMDGDRNDEAFNMLTGVADKDAMQPNINPEIPVVIVEHTFRSGRKMESTTLVIDGNKRLRKAFLEGTEKVKGYFLPKKLSKLCLLS